MCICSTNGKTTNFHTKKYKIYQKTIMLQLKLDSNYIVIYWVLNQVVLPFWLFLGWLSRAIPSYTVETCLMLIKITPIIEIIWILDLVASCDTTKNLIYI